MHIHIAMYGREIHVPSGEALMGNHRCCCTTANGHLLCLQQRAVQTVEVYGIRRAIRRIADDGDVKNIEVRIRNLYLCRAPDPNIVVLSLRIT